ncbi:MAG: glycosyltransferase family 1 protein [Deltaproteobacteria bacterium]|nr:glycosyltransferase family 1 protein [Deltaproteobacteria bacterium]
MDMNMRVFETLANGQCMLLTNTYDGLGYEELFEEGRHYIGFRTEEEAVQKALYYSKNPEEAIEIAREGQRRVLETTPMHTGAVRSWPLSLKAGR